jgi:alpha-beta hydrolase superfamily lysophospholipase
MRGQGAFVPRELIDQLGDFSIRPGTQPDALPGYVDFYHLDFAAAHPGLQHHIGWVPSGEFQIATQLFALPQARGTAFVCHGYYDHVGLFGHLIRYLLDQQLNVLTFDFPGHGLSSGPRATIASFDHYVAVLVDLQHYLAQELGERVDEWLPQSWYVFGQSMGGAIALEYLLQYGHERFREIVLFAPLIRPAAWGFNRWVYEIAKRTIIQRKRTITENAENPEFIALMRIDPLAPDTLPVQWVTAMVEWMKAFEQRGKLPFKLHIAQGDADQTIDWRHNLKFFASHTDVDLLRIAGARHHLVNESEAIRNQLFRWIGGFIEPAAVARDSGSDR